MWREKDSWTKFSKLNNKKSVSAEDKVEDFCNNFLTGPRETTTENESDINLVLRKLCVSYPNNIIIDHLNIKAIRNKFEIWNVKMLVLADYMDVSMISESIRSGTFPSL